MAANKYMCHGMVLYRLIGNQSINIYQDKKTSAYIINDKIAIMIKYSTKRLSPWTFTINRDFNFSIDSLSNDYIVFVTLVCNDDGIACLTYDDYSYITCFGSYDINSIFIKRKKNESYTVKGTERSLEHKVKDCDLPNLINSLI